MIHRVYAVTNRRLCTDSFSERIAALCRGGIDGIILREKDLSHQDYTALAKQILDVCDRFCVPLTIHSDIESARLLSVPRVQLPFPIFYHGVPQGSFSDIGVSVHSAKEAQYAQRFGADRLTAGHIFPTACKPGLAPRGLDFLRRVCSSVQIPVYAIGGITRENMMEVFDAGAAGVCIMSEFMTCSKPEDVVRSYRETIRRG